MLLFNDVTGRSHHQFVNVRWGASKGCQGLELLRCWDAVFSRHKLLPPSLSAVFEPAGFGLHRCFSVRNILLWEVHENKCPFAEHCVGEL